MRGSRSSERRGVSRTCDLQFRRRVAAMELHGDSRLCRESPLAPRELGPVPQRLKCFRYPLPMVSLDLYGAILDRAA